MFIEEIDDIKYYFDRFIMWFPSYLELLDNAQTKGEKNGIKQRMIADLKKQEYPKGITRKVANYIKNDL